MGIFRRTVRLPLYVLLLLWGVFVISPLLAQPAAESGGKTVYTLELRDQIITPTVAEYIEQGLTRAEEAQAAALIIELDTPGGLLSATQTIVKRLMNAKVPVVVYVTPQGARAASAGVFITMAAHVAAMAPSTRIGAAHPVTIGGGDPGGRKLDFEKIKERLKGEEEGKEQQKAKPKAKPEEEAAPGGAMGEKIMQDTIAWVKGIARARGRNVEWAVEAVVESRSSTAEEAKKLGVIDLVVENRAALLDALDGRTVKIGPDAVTLATRDAAVETIAMTGRQQLLQVLSNPNIAYILMMLGFYGLLFEITHPGSWIPGITGAICLILAFYALQTLPTNYAGLAFIILALGLFVAEVYVTSYGLLALVGIGCLFIGSLILIDSPLEFLRVSLSVIIPVVGATAVIAIGLVSLVVKAQRRKVAVGAEGMVGQHAIVDQALNPVGKVRVGDEIWDAEAEQPLDVGAKVEVVEMVEGMRLLVKPE